MKLEHCKPGMTVWEVRRQKMGNTTMPTLALYSLRIKEVDLENRLVFASWNGNAPKWFYRVSKWKKEKPYLVTSALGYGKRRPTKEELSEHRKKLKEAKTQKED